MRTLIVALAMAAGGCGTSVAPTQVPIPTIEAPSFDVTAVRANFVEECRHPIIVDELFCEQVRISEMSGEGSILDVPTTLAPAEGFDDRANAICAMLATGHFDGEGRDLGYHIIGVLDKDGGNAAACSVE
jgi:hypothetical protein